MPFRNAVLVLVSILILGGLFFVLRPDPPSSEPGNRSVEVGISDGSMDPREIPVRQGDRVRLRITSDSPVEIHVHGYDLEGEVGPGQETVLSFEADDTGRFPIEDHETGAGLGVLVVEPR